MPARTLQVAAASITTELSVNIPKIFDQAQVSTANHQKNFVALHKLHVEAAQHTETVRGGLKLVGERAFEEAFLYMLTRVLPLKKGTTPADRIVKLVGGYTKFINEKAAEEKIEAEREDAEDEDTPASRFTARLLKFLLKGFQAKDKSVRNRVLQTVAEMVSHLGEIDEEIYTELRAALLDRVHDKEAPVRVQAVIALSKLSGSEDPSEVAEGEQTVADVLIDILAHDSSSDVRRAVLLNIPINQTTLPHVLDRTRDTDTTIRKLVYSAVLEPNTTQHNSMAMGATHPRALTIAQRESIVQNGLGDRDSAVRLAAGSLLGTWTDVVGDLKVIKTKTEEVEVKMEDAVQVGTEKIESAVVALLHMFDLGESTVAADALLSVFATRVDIFDNIEFGEKYWTNLTPETAFLARVFVEHCKATKDDVRLEAALPVVTALAFRIQESYNTLMEDLQAEEEEKIIRDVIDVDDDERVRREDSRIDKEFVIGEMLALAVNLDYADEIGRRKMFQLVRDMLAQESLPQSLLAKCLDVLRKLSANERDLIRVVVEIVHDLRDPGGDDDDGEPAKDADAETNFGDTPATVRPARAPMFQKPVAAMSPEEKRHADEIDLRCLSLCIGMLERVNGTFEENSTLAGILDELVAPAVRRKDIAFREKGLISLGMCCLINRRLALANMGTFMDQVLHSPEALRIHLLEVIFDSLMVHENDFLAKDGSNAERITQFLMDLLGKESSDKVLALLCVGISKLILSGMIIDPHAVKNLIMAYLSPLTAENQELRQCLTFFFPVYCYSSPSNQQCIRKIFIEVYKKLNEVRKEMEEDEEMVSAAHVGALFVDWTDPLKLMDAKTGDVKGPVVDDSIQLEMASDIVKALIDKDDELDKDEKKALCQLLGKLHIPDTVDDNKLRELKLCINNLRTRRPLRDTTSNNNFNKFDALICKKFEKQLEDFSEEEYRKLEELKELFDFLDSIIPEDDDEADVDAPKKKGRKRRSESIVSTSTEADGPGTPSRRGKSKSKPKRRRVSKSSDEESDGIDEITPPPRSSIAPTRALPKRGAAKKHVVIEISSDSDEDSTPVPSKGRQRESSGTTSQRVKEEADIDADIDDLLDEGTSNEIPHDSIIDNSEEEEDEVNDLLADD